MECSEWGPRILSLWGGVQRHHERYGEVCHIHARHPDRPGLRDEPILREFLGKIYDPGSEMEQRAAGEPAELEPVFVCLGRPGQPQGRERAMRRLQGRRRWRCRRRRRRSRWWGTWG